LKRAAPAIQAKIFQRLKWRERGLGESRIIAVPQHVLEISMSPEAALGRAKFALPADLKERPTILVQESATRVTRQGEAGSIR
jgi:hypothetical protein